MTNSHVISALRLKRAEISGPMSPNEGSVYSASLDHRSETVCVLSVIIAELEFGDIERHIFAAHFVERANHARLKIDQKPSMVCVWIAPMTY